MGNHCHLARIQVGSSVTFFELSSQDNNIIYFVKYCSCHVSYMYMYVMYVVFLPVHV